MYTRTLGNGLRVRAEPHEADEFYVNDGAYFRTGDFSPVDATDNVSVGWTYDPDTGNFIAPPPSEQRRLKYESLPIIPLYEDRTVLISIDRAREECLNYFFDKSDSAQAIVAYYQAQITEKKQTIRDSIPNQ
jgi:hypothetical protein